MFRLTFLLCGTIFLTMLIGGQDRGQLRFGLMPQGHNGRAEGGPRGRAAHGTGATGRSVVAMA